MKLKHLVLSAVVILTCAVWSMAQEEGKIETTYDRFDDVTTVTLDFMQVKQGRYGYDGILINATFRCPGKVQSCKPQRAYMGVSIVLKDTAYDAPANLTVLADDERFPLGNMLRLKTDTALEQWNLIATVFMVPIPADDFIRIARAKQVEMRIDRTEFELSKEHRSKLYEFASSIQR
jgi:hypothetical protein